MKKSEKILEVMMLLDDNPAVLDEVYIMLKERQVKLKKKSLTPKQIEQQAKILLEETLPGFLSFKPRHKPEKQEVQQQNRIPAKKVRRG